MTPASIIAVISANGVWPTYTSQVLRPFLASATKRSMPAASTGAIRYSMPGKRALTRGIPGCRSSIHW